MARLTFPSTGLYNGYQYIGGNGITYVYDGSKWRGQVPSITVISSSSISNHGNIVEVDEYGNLRLPYYVFPPTTGTFGEVLSWPISGSVLEWKKLQASTIDFSNITNVPAFSTATKLSNLLNDVGYLTSSTVLPYIPTQVSSFTNDVGYLTSSTVLPYIPTQVSSFTNDVGYLTSSTVLPYIPTQVSSFTNDVGYLTSSSNVAYSKITGAPFVISNQYLLTDEKIISLSTSSSLSLSSGSGIQVGPTTGTFASWSFDGISNWQSSGGIIVGTSGILSVLSSVLSTSTVTGALVVKGGVGIGGNLNIGGIVNISNTLSSTSTITGAVVVAGGVGISGNLYANNIYSNNASVITTATLFNNLTGVASVVNSNTWTATQSLAGSASTLGTVITTAAELTYIINTPPPSTSTMYLNLGEVQYFTVASTSNWVTNFAFSNTTPLNTALSTGQSTTVVTMSVQGTTAYYNTGILIDGITINPYWQGGAAPSNGYPSGIDVYTYTIIKIGNATFTVLATQTRF